MFSDVTPNPIYQFSGNLFPHVVLFTTPVEKLQPEDDTLSFHKIPSSLRLETTYLFNKQWRHFNTHFKIVERSYNSAPCGQLMKEPRVNQNAPFTNLWLAGLEKLLNDHIVYVTILPLKLQVVL